MSKIKLRFLTLAVCAFVVVILSQGTTAYYSTVGAATNVVTSGDIQLVIHETTGNGDPFPEEGMYILPGQIVSKKVTIENDCTHPVYLRVKLVSGIDSAEVSEDDFFDIDLNESSWTLREDGFIYYNDVLQPGETTAPVFTEVEIVGERVNNSHIGKTLSLTVNAYAVQEENNPAANPWDAAGWPAEREVTE